MIPWPIAVLSVYYGIIATLAAATMWRILTGVTDRSLVWQMVWLGLSAGAMCGLPLLKRWGRTLAIWTSVLLMVVLLVLSGLLVLKASEPGVGVLLTFGAGLQMLAIRYLQRPLVRRLFENAECGVRNSE